MPRVYWFNRGYDGLSNDFRASHTLGYEIHEFLSMLQANSEKVIDQWTLLHEHVAEVRDPHLL